MVQKSLGRSSGKTDMKRRLLIIRCNHIHLIIIAHSIHNLPNDLLLFLLRQPWTEFEAEKAIVADVKCPLGTSCKGGDFVEPAP